MDLSTQSMQEFPFIKSRNGSATEITYAAKSDMDFNIIDVTKIKFEDETWLYKVSDCCPVTDLRGWLYNDDISEDYSISAVKSQNEMHKNIDSRTFTRPKKRFMRPSIEKYNEEVYGSPSDTQNEHNTRKTNNSIIQEVSEPVPTQSKPLNFDLTQPTNSYYFENILANSAEIDSFQNMSPPSLVNSMCSSTFANLMESSFIKNDPVLREIRDTDYTETVLLQDSEPPMFQSITESCSSISSDTPESFLKKMSFNGTFRKNTIKEFDQTLDKASNTTVNLNTTYEKPVEPDPEEQSTLREENQSSNHTFSNFNGTYRRTPKSKGTFKKSDIKLATSALNSTFDMSPDIDLSDKNTTQALIKDCSLKSFGDKNMELANWKSANEDSLEDIKKQFSETEIQVTDLNRLSYCLNETITLDNNTFTENDNLNRDNLNIKQASLGCSTGSADSLDRMSSLSNSSRESNKMLNMADVDAIVEMQERSLQQVMSTPKIARGGTQKLWENNFISPIIPSDQLSDSDVSSTDEYKSVKSTLSKASLENYISKPVKSLGYLGSNVDTKIKNTQRSAYTIASQKPLHAMPNNLRSSYGNLKTIQSSLPGSQNNLYRPSNVKPTSTNLKTMGQRLKGSYTSLRPISANLPVAPPIGSQLNVTSTLSKATNPNVTQIFDTRSKVAEVPPMPRERINVAGDNPFVKPQPTRASGLPRPTGIPRPASRIPGPRSNIRLSGIDPLDLYNDHLLRFISKYKFIISFENAICDDYITEKLWRPLIIGSIPIYLGSPTIEDWLPNKNSAILIKEYSNLEEVGNLIKKINSNDTLYNSFLEHKIKSKISNPSLENMVLKKHPIPVFECFVCNQLHQKSEAMETKFKDFNVYECPKPRPPEKENTWDQHWDVGKCQAKALEILLSKNVPYSSALFEHTWKSLFYSENC